MRSTFLSHFPRPVVTLHTVQPCVIHNATKKKTNPIRAFVPQWRHTTTTRPRFAQSRRSHAFFKRKRNISRARQSRFEICNSDGVEWEHFSRSTNFPADWCGFFYKYVAVSCSYKCVIFWMILLWLFIVISCVKWVKYGPVARDRKEVVKVISSWCFWAVQKARLGWKYRKK